MHRASREFESQKRRSASAAGGGEREQALQRLENAYYKYKELVSNVEVGRKFYNDLSRIVGGFRDSARAFVAERRAEARALEDELSMPPLQGLSLGHQQQQQPSPPPPQQQQNEETPADNGEKAPEEKKRKSSGYPFLDSLVPSFLSVDVDGRVVRLDTFSKTVAPGCRLGFVTAQPDLIERFVRVAESSTQQPSGFVQSVIAELIIGTQPPEVERSWLSLRRASERATFTGWDTAGWVR